MLILEGPDMVGKTTLTRKLKLLMPEMQLSVRGLAHAEWKPHEWVEGMKERTICDRGHMSEVVYGLNLRGKCNLSPLQYRSCDDAVAYLGGFTVVITASEKAYQTLVTNHYDPAKEAFTAEQCIQINDSYHDFLDNKLGINGIRYVPMYEFTWDITLDEDGKLVRPTDDWVKRVAHRYRALTKARKAGSA